LFRQALDVANQLPASPNDWSLGIRSALAHVIAEEGNPNQADAALNGPPRPVFAPPLKAQTAPGPDLSGPLADIARASQFSSEGNEVDAESSYQRAISALEKIASPAAEGRLDSALLGLADLYRREHRYAEAEATLSRGFDLWARMASGPGGRFAATPPLGEIQGLYFDEKRPEAAEALYQRTLDIQGRVLPPDDPSIGRTLTIFADAYRQEGNYEAALPLLERALPIREKESGADSPLLISTLDFYATALEKMSRLSEAAAVRARIARIEKKSEPLSR
jgi:tetratricopeptide (TPR) repeat protein